MRTLHLDVGCNTRMYLSAMSQRVNRSRDVGCSVKRNLLSRHEVSTSRHGVDCSDGKYFFVMSRRDLDFMPIMVHF